MAKTLQILKAYDELFAKVNEHFFSVSKKKYNNNTWNLEQLDHWRNVELPNRLKLRLEKDGTCYLVLEELMLVMDWKLAKGKFRPFLPKLIRSNDEKSVQDITRNAFTGFIEAVKNYSVGEKLGLKYLDAVKNGMNELCKLKGVGPATASLILSLLNKITVYSPPFFSDEAFLYYVVDRNRPGTKIKYDMKEYLGEYMPVFLELFSEDVTMDMLEKGAWSLKMVDVRNLDIDMLGFDVESLNHYKEGENSNVISKHEGEPQRKRARRK